MPAQTGPNEGINFGWDLGEFWKTEMDDTLKLIDGVLHLGVLDKDLNDDPGGSTVGDRYIVGPVPAGAWAAASAGDVAIYIDPDGGGAVWEFRTPKLGWVAFVLDELFQYRWSGSGWVLLTAPASTSEPITDLALSGATPMDLSLGRNFRTPGATGAVTLSFSNVPPGVRTEIRYTWVLDGVGGHTLNFPAGTQWPNGVPPVPSSGANQRDEYLFDIDDAGVISGNVVGQAYA